MTHPTHRILVPPGVFRSIKRGDRKHDYRRDLGFADHQRILYEEWDPGESKLTGDDVLMSITAMTRGPDQEVPRGFVVLSLAPVQRPAYVPGDLAADRKARDGRGAEKL